MRIVPLNVTTMRATEELKQYGIDKLISELGQLINEIQKIRNKLPVGELTGDARHVALAGMQTTLSPIVFSLKCISYTADNTDREKLGSFLKMPTQKLTYFTDNFIKSSLSVFFHFKIENLFTNIVFAFNPNYNGRGYEKISNDFFNVIIVTDKDYKKNCIKVLANLRNGFHNEGIHRNADFTQLVGTFEWRFIRGQEIKNETFDLINLLKEILNILDNIINAPEILALTSPIIDVFNSKYILPTDQEFSANDL